MNTTEILQQAIAHHQAGNLPEARQLYESLLKAEPHDPDANHNLGVLLIALGENEAALSHLQAALEADPARGEFWLDFIRALMLFNRQDEAREILVMAQNNGLSGSAIDDLAAQLAPASPPPKKSEAEYTGEIIGFFNSAQYAQAETLARLLTQHYPRNVFGWKALGTLLAQQGRLAEAEPVLKKAIKLSPKDPDLHNNLGNLQANLGQDDEAIRNFQLAIKLNPAYADAHYNLGNALKRRGKLKEAVASYRRAIRGNPAHVAAYGNMANALSELRAEDEAMTAYREALRLNPGNAEVMGNLGALLLETDHIEEAGDLFRNALSLNAENAGAHYRMGLFLEKMNQREAAIASYRQALALDPAYADAWNDLGAIFKSQGDTLAAFEAYQQALRIKPDFAKAYSNLGVLQYDAGNVFSAIHSFETALKYKPDYAVVHSNLGLAKSSLGLFDEAVQDCQKALELDAEYHGAMNNLLFCVNYHPEKSGEAIYRYYEAYQARYGLPLQAAWKPHGNDRSPGRRLRVGYVSAGFHYHSSRHFLEPLLSHHDRNQFEIYAYAQIIGEDAVTQRYQSYADDWLNTRGMSDAQLADRIRADGIDILVDLAGHTGHNRLLVFARKPAPVSLHWLDFGYTTGLKAIDYYLGDPVMTPEGCESVFSEQIWRLPATSYVYRPDPGMGEVTPLPAQTNGYITFGTLTRSVRLNDRVIRVWSEILKRVPHSKLIINSGNFKDPAMQERMAERFVAQGIERERLDIGLQSPAWQVLQRMDISLDCFPHNSGTTLFESLYMGVPFVTLASRPSVGTLGAGVLAAVGHPEWTAQNEEDYIEKAVELAEDQTRLAAIRATLRQEMQQSPLMDETGFAREVEHAYRQMWQKWCETIAQ